MNFDLSRRFVELKIRFSDLPYQSEKSVYRKPKAGLRLIEPKSQIE